jgi:hypothetical protein
MSFFCKNADLRANNKERYWRNQVMSKSITISGNPIVGNIVQGSNNSVSSVISDVHINELYEKTKSAISDLGNELNLPNEKIQVALEYLGELEKGSRESQPNLEGGNSIFQHIKTNATWAYPILKDFIKAVWPTLLSFI